MFNNPETIPPSSSISRISENPQSLRVVRYIVPEEPVITALRLASLAASPHPTAEVARFMASRRTKSLVAPNGGLTIFSKGQYRKETRRTPSLGNYQLGTVATAIMNRIPDTHSQVLRDVPVTSLELFGSVLQPVVAVALHSPELEEEFEATKGVIEELGEGEIEADFVPHVSLARINMHKQEISDDRLQRIASFVPRSISLLPLQIEM